MARPKKHHLDYFPKEVSQLSNRKIRRLLKNHDAQGYLVYEYLLILIYGTNGYYLNFDKDLCFDISDFLPESISENLVKEILDTCLELELFDKNLYQKEKILTNLEIQKTYITARKGKVELIKKYIINDAITGVLEEKTKVIDTKTPVLSSKTPKNEVKSAQKKRKEKKREEIKIKYNKRKGKENIKESDNPPQIRIEKNSVSKKKNNQEQNDKEVLKKEKEKSSAKKEKEDFEKCKTIILTRQESYYWQVEDDKALSQLLKMLLHSINNTGTEQSLAESFEFFIQNLPKYWIEKKFTVPNLCKNYNEIINEIKQNYEREGLQKSENTNEKRTTDINEFVQNFGK